MFHRRPAWLLLVVGALTHCSSTGGTRSDTSSTAGDPSNGGTSNGAPAAAASSTAQPGAGTTAPDDRCQPGHALTGVSYDITKSKFAFGGMPTESDEGANKRWTGPLGQLVIFPFGEGAAPDATAPSKADWSNDPNALLQHVTDYFVSLGVARCQIQNAHVIAGSEGRSIIMGRAIDGIVVDRSTASARFDVDDQSTQESLTWPTIPATSVSDARAFRDQLAAPGGLAAYQAKLPETARGPGAVEITHSFASATTMTVRVVWSTMEGQSPVLFDANANVVNPLQL